MGYILTQEGYLEILASGISVLKAADANGMQLQDDAGNLGITVADGGSVQVASLLFVNETINANMTTGITLKGTAWEESIAFKVDTLDHQLTVWTETDTAFARQVAEVGAVYDYLVMDEGVGAYSAAYTLSVATLSAETTKTTSTDCMIMLYATCHNGLGTRTDVTANGAVFGVAVRTTGTIWILDEDGDTWQTGVMTAASLVLGVTALSEANLIDLTDAGETSLHTHPAAAGADSTAIHDNVASEISAITDKASPVGADMLLIEDSEAANVKKRVSITNLPGGADTDAIHDNVSGEIVLITEKATPVSGDLLLIEDSAASNAKKRLQIGNLPVGVPTEIWDADTNTGIQVEEAADENIIRFDAAATEVGVWDATSLTMGLQPCFSAYAAAMSNLDINTDHTITYSGERFDVGGDYNTSTYTFTAPATGKYLLIASIFGLQADTSATYYRISIVNIYSYQ
jgi:hypothetical protein